MTRPTPKDIAVKAGVSVALVFFVLNGQHENRIKKSTAVKIKAIANELGYRTNKFAKGLKTNRSLHPLLKFLMLCTAPLGYLTGVNISHLFLR